MKTLMPTSPAPVVIATLCVACSNTTPVAPKRASAVTVDTATPHSEAVLNPDLAVALATMRAATAAYHDVQNALNDGFVLRHTCGEPGEDGPLTVYRNRDRVRDGKIDPALPDALLYEPTPDGPRLVGVELIMPLALWTSPEPPTFFGVPFEREDTAFGLHVWLWLHNPDGMFEETNPQMTC